MRQIIALFLLLGVAAYAQHDHNHGQKKEAQHDDNHGQKKEAPQAHEVIFLPTIQCETCVQRVESAVKKVAGVKLITVELGKKLAHVNFDAKKTSLEKIETAIAAAGYDANKTKRDEAAHAKLLKCCQSERK